MDFDLAEVGALQFPPPGKASKPEGEYCFELHGGMALFGSLAGLTSKETELDTPRFGRLHVERTRLERITRWRDGEDLNCAWPNGLSKGNESGPDGAWRQDANHLATDREGAWISGNLPIPPRACIELEFSWTRNADFMIVLGTRNKDGKKAFCLETWNQKLLCLWESEHEADLAMLQETGDAEGRCRLAVYLDQTHRRATVFSADGSPLADLNMPGAPAEPQSGIYVLNRRGGLQISQLRVRKLLGDMPQRATHAKPHVCRTDGSSVVGDIARFDARKREFVLVENNREMQIDAASVESVVFSQPEDVTPRNVNVWLHDGTRLGGKLRKATEDRIWLECPGVAEPLSIIMSDLQELSVLSQGKTRVAAAGERQGRLEMPGVRLHGSLVDGAELSRPGCLAWRPRDGMTASPLQPGEAGRVVYRDTMPAMPAPDVRCSRVARAPGGPNWFEVLAGGASPPTVQRGSLKNSGVLPNAGTLYLRTAMRFPVRSSGSIRAGSGLSLPSIRRRSCRTRRSRRPTWKTPAETPGSIRPNATAC